MAMSLYQPPIGSVGWGANVNQNFEKLQDFCNALNVAGGLVQLDGSNRYPGLNGELITSLNASQLASGEVPFSRLPLFVGANGSNGQAGAVPAPAAGDAAKYLAGDATWKSLPAVPQVFYNANQQQFGTSGYSTLLNLGNLPTGYYLIDCNLVLHENADAGFRLNTTGGIEGSIAWFQSQANPPYGGRTDVQEVQTYFANNSARIIGFYVAWAGAHGGFHVYTEGTVTIEATSASGVATVYPWSPTIVYRFA